MKYLGLLLLVVLFSASAFSQTISHTGHDFSGETWNSGEICQPCHTPHNARLKDDYLWNHQASPDNYFTWESRAVDATSKKCLDCHDGQIALDAFGQRAGGSTKMPGTKNLGVDLTDDHPISFAVNPYEKDGTTLKAGYFKSARGSISLGSYGSTTSGAMRLKTMDDGTYIATCSTCHTAHGKFKVGSTTTVTPSLLRMENTASAMCQACHNK